MSHDKKNDVTTMSMRPLWCHMMHAIVISAHYTSICYCIYCSDERKLATLSVQLSKMNSSSEHSFKTKEVGVGMVILCCNFLIFDTRLSLECVGTLFSQFCLDMESCLFPLGWLCWWDLLVARGTVQSAAGSQGTGTAEHTN